MSKRLLDRQVSLLAYLTSGSAIFGEEDDVPLDPDLRGMDRRLLRLEARFSHEKRMEKIAAVFPRTLEILGDNARLAMLQTFAEACPPIDISRIVNANQFHDFLAARKPNDFGPPYLPDVAACELACAKVRAAVDEQVIGKARGRKRRSPGSVRRSPGVALLRCAYDIRPIFEDGLGAVEERETPLAVAMMPASPDPRIFEVAPVVFDLLAALDDWTDPLEFGDAQEVRDLSADLIEHGLIEVSR
jgi:hypothetical protein